MRRAMVALATLLCFGCRTVQPGGAVAPPAPSPPPRVALAEPLLDLWLEGAGSVPPAETDQALAQARAALGAALDGRGFVPAEEAELLLVVQAQGLARTEGRRQQQAAAAVGIALIVVALVVVVVIASRGKSGGSSRAPVAAAPGRAPGRGLPGAVRPVQPLPPLRFGPPVPWFGWNVELGYHYPVAVAAAPPGPPQLLPDLEQRLDRRGFFAGDEVELVLELRDARSGETIWSHRTRGEIDPRDPAAVRALLDEAARDQPWARALAATP